MKTTHLCLLSSIITVMGSFTIYASGNIAFGPKIGTQGVGLEASYKVNDYLSLNANANGFRITDKLNNSGINYNGHLRLLTFGLTANVHPFKNGFKLMGGVYYNLNKIDVSANPTRNVTISGRTYTPTQLGQLNGSVDFNKLSPYLALGYDSAFYNESPWSFNGELGVMFQGTPKTHISSTGTLANSSQQMADLKQNIQKAADKNYFKFYPVLSIGVKYRF